MFLIDLEQGRIVSDDEIKAQLAAQQPYGEWLKAISGHAGQAAGAGARAWFRPRDDYCRGSGRSGIRDEDVRMLMTPMAVNGEEPLGSMGVDTPLACLSDKPQPLFNYFKQLFAQVTNPPIDPIREEMVMSLVSYIGTERNILAETPKHCHTLKLPHPIVTNRDLEKLRRVSHGDFLATTLPTLFHAAEGEEGSGAGARRGVPAGVAGDRFGLYDSDPFGSRRGCGLCADSESAGADGGTQPSGSGRIADAGGADHRIGRAARGDALRAADRVWGERGESLSGD